MADPINPFDFVNETLATFLAKTVGNGTYADVVEALKIDQVGEEAEATEIRVAAGQIYGNTIDDFVLAAYPLLRTVATGGGGGGSRLAFNPTPTIGGTPFASTYTALFDEAIAVSDGGGPPTTFVSTLPDISTASPGDQIGMLLVDGNPSKEITFSPVVTDQIIDPATGAPVGPAGTSLVLAAGAYASAVWLVWEAVQSAGGPASPQWQYIGDRAFASATPRLDEVLAAGPNTNGEGVFVTQGDLLGFDSRTSPLGTPAAAPTFGTFSSDIKAGDYYREEVVASGSAVFVDLPTPVFSRPGGDTGNTLHVRITAVRRENTGVFADNIMCVLEEIWSVGGSGTWAQDEVLVSSTSAAANFQLAGNGDDLFLQMLRDVTNGYTAKYRVTYHAALGSATA
jgi:hypothetical protein